MARKMSGTKKLATYQQEDLRDEVSTVAPSDSLRDDVSEFTDTSGWCGVEPGRDELEEVPEQVPVTSSQTGRLVEGPGGRPTREYRSSAELRAARLQQLQEPAQQSRGAKSTTGTANAPKTGAKPRADDERKAAKQALKEKFAAQAAKGPQAKTEVTRRVSAPSAGTPHSLPCGYISFRDTPGGYPKAQSKTEIQKQHNAKDAKIALDNASQESLKEMGLWEYMPVKNPVITQSDSKRGGYNWHMPFPAQEFQHTLGGVPDSKPVARPHRADEMHRQLDKMTRENLRSMGLWEHCPGNNPVAIESNSKRGGVNWTISPF